MSIATAEPPPGEEGGFAAAVDGGFAAAVQAWEVELADAAAMVADEAAWEAAEYARELAADPALAVAVGQALDQDRIDETDDERLHTVGAPALSGDKSRVPDALVSDFALVQRIKDLEGRVAVLQAEQAAALVELAGRSVFARRDRPDLDPAARARLGVDTPEERAERAAYEVAAALRLAPPTAARRVAVAVELQRELPATYAQLRAGRIGWRQAVLVCELTRPLPPAARAAVEARAVEVAHRCTPGQLERHLKGWVITVDPAGAADRHARARADRSVRLRPLEDGMAELRAILTAEAAQRVATAVDAVATGLREQDPQGERRTLNQGRADALEAIAADVLAAGHTGCAAPSCGEGCTNDTDPAEPTDHAEPGEHAGTGDDADASAGDGSPPGGAGPPGRRRGRRLARWRGHRPHVEVTVAASTLLGADELPGWLAGHGPITADQARRIAADGMWRRLMTDPADGRLLDYGRSRRDPPRELADFVIARDRTDRFPTSLVPARRCDLDHATPWEAGGPTDAWNLNALSGRAHQVRHDTGWTLTRLDDGSLRWRSPTGHTYRTPVEQLGPTPADRALAGLGASWVDASSGCNGRGNLDASAPSSGHGRLEAVRAALDRTGRTRTPEADTDPDPPPF